MNGKYPSLLKLLHKLIMMRYITEKSDTHKSSIKKPDRKKRYFLQFILLLGLVASLSSCRTSAPRLDYQALARASILLGVDINMEDNHKLYLEAADWIGVPYRGGGDSKRGADCSGLVYQVYRKVYRTQVPRNTEDLKKKAIKSPNGISGKETWYSSPAVVQKIK